MVITDCSGLEQSQGVPLEQMKNSCVQRMYRDLEERDLSYRFKFCPGKENQAADALSRAPIANTLFNEGSEMMTEARISSLFCSDSNVECVGESDRLEDLDMDKIREAIVKDKDYIRLLQAVIKGDHPKNWDKSHPSRHWMGVWQHLSVLENSGPIIYDGERIILPKCLQIPTIVELHNMTHGSTEKMINTLKKYYVCGREENSPKPEIMDTRNGMVNGRTQSVCYPYNPAPMSYSNFQAQGVYPPASAPAGYNHNNYVNAGPVTPYMGTSMGTKSNPTATKHTVSIGVTQVPKSLSEELSESQRQREILAQENASIHARLLDPSLEMRL